MGLEGETTDALLGGIRADGTAAERPRGWAAVVAPALSYRSVQRLNASTVLIDVAAPARAIEAPEQISVVVPRAALASADANLTVYPELAIRPTPGTLELAGSLWYLLLLILNSAYHSSSSSFVTPFELLLAGSNG